MALGQVRQQEVPSLLGVGVGPIGTDVATPNDACTSTHQVTGQTGRLGIMEDHDVARFDPPTQCGRVGLEDRAVVAIFFPIELSGISWYPVESVVESLGDGEERFAASIITQRVSIPASIA